MAGDWIKIRKCLFTHPKVMRMARDTGLCEETIVGWLAKVWTWADDATESGNVPSVTHQDIVRVTGASVKFLASMQSVGWLVQTTEGVMFPDYDSHMSNTAKKRANTQKRVARHRKIPSNAAVTLAALPEKRREEKKKDKGATAPISRFRPPSVKEVAARISERKLNIDADEFHAYYESQGWKKANGQAVKKWDACLTTWTKSRGNNGAAKKSPPPPRRVS